MGLGYIGLPTAITLAEAGFEVCGFDVNKKTIETLQGGHIHIVEPGLQEAFEKAVAHGHLHFSDTLGKSDVFYISVPTPFYKDETGSHKADLKFVESAGRMAGKVLEAPNLVILRVHRSAAHLEMLARVLSEESGIPMEKIHVAHCPERVIPGNMMYELKNNDRIVGARTPEAAEMAASIYEKVLDKGVVQDRRPDRRDVQADREYLPRRQHRLRERAVRHLRQDGHRRIRSSSSSPTAIRASIS